MGPSRQFYKDTTAPLSPGHVWSYDSGQGWYQRALPQAKPKVGEIGRSLMSADAEIGPAPKKVTGGLLAPEAAARGLISGATGFDSPLLGLSAKKPFSRPSDIMEFAAMLPLYAKELGSVWSGGAVQKIKQ